MQGKHICIARVHQYRKSHCGDKTILRPSYLHNGISYTGKTSLYWIGAQVSSGYPRLISHRTKGFSCGFPPQKSTPWCCLRGLCSTPPTHPTPPPNPLKPGVKSRKNMLQLHMSDQQFFCQLMCTYINGLTVCNVCMLCFCIYLCVILVRPVSLLVMPTGFNL